MILYSGKDYLYVRPDAKFDGSKPIRYVYRLSTLYAPESNLCPSASNYKLRRRSLHSVASSLFKRNFLLDLGYYRPRFPNKKLKSLASTLMELELSSPVDFRPERSTNVYHLCFRCNRALMSIHTPSSTKTKPFSDSFASYQLQRRHSALLPSVWTWGDAAGTVGSFPSICS